MRSVSIDRVVSKIMASLYSWLQSGQDKESTPLLPAATDPCTSAANEEVEVVLKKKRRKRGKYNYYEPEVRAKIAKHACLHGNNSAIVKYSKDLGHSVSESSVRNIKKVYLNKLKTVQDPNDIVSLPHATQGRPLLLGELVDSKVAGYIHALRLAGGIVNRSIVQAAAKGILSHLNPSSLQEHGGHINIGVKWAESFLKRRSYVKRKATKAARKVPHNFDDLKAAFLQRIRDEIEQHAIPPSLVINWDQTGSKLIPVSQWTLAKQGSRQVPVIGKDDKREITVLLAVSASGTLLPPQVIYAGKTQGCHAKITFPRGWHITRSDNHWSTEATMLQYIDEVVVPYFSAAKRELELPEDHVCLAIFDVFVAHRCDSVLQKLNENHIHQVFVPASCTGELQPLDLSVNDEFKALMKDSFSRWYAHEIKEALDQGENLNNVKVDLRASIIKPLHGNWLITAISTLQSRTESLCRGFEMAGILDCLH